MDNENGGFKTWTPTQWILVIGSVATAVIGIVNAIVGNPASIPGMG